VQNRFKFKFKFRCLTRAILIIKNFLLSFNSLKIKDLVSDNICIYIYIYIYIYIIFLKINDKCRVEMDIQYQKRKISTETS